MLQGYNRYPHHSNYDVRSVLNEDRYKMVQTIEFFLNYNLIKLLN